MRTMELPFSRMRFAWVGVISFPNFSFMKKFADQGRAHRNVGFVPYFYIAGIRFGANYFYANFFSITYIILETFAAVMSETMVIADNQIFYLITLF